MLPAINVKQSPLFENAQIKKQNESKQRWQMEWTEGTAFELS